MKNKILLILSIILFLIYMYQKRSINNDTSFFDANNTVKNIYEDQIEDYLIHIVAAEMPASFEMESLKAQAIASRTFIYNKIVSSSGNYDFQNDKTSQAYISTEQMHEKWDTDYEKYLNKITKAITETRSQVITYDDMIICSYYYAMSNGRTETSLNVFNEEHPYLVSVESLEPQEKQEKTIIISKESFLNNLNLDMTEISIQNIIYDETNHVKTIVINNKTFTGIEIRKLLNLRSTDFTFNITEENVIIKTRGYGHGVGMSQYGSNEYAKTGMNYLEIINHYYPNTIVKNINSILFE